MREGVLVVEMVEQFHVVVVHGPVFGLVGPHHEKTFVLEILTAISFVLLTSHRLDLAFEVDIAGAVPVVLDLSIAIIETGHTEGVARDFLISSATRPVAVILQIGRAHV